MSSGLSNAFTFDVDSGKKVYWADNITKKIQRANLDGTSVEDLVTGLSSPFGVVVEPAAASTPVPGLSVWGLVAMAILLGAGAIYARRRVAGSRV